MHKAKLTKEPTFDIWGSGKPLREFLYIDDLSKAIEFLINNEIDDDLINIGSGEEISIYDLSILIKEVIKYPGDLVFDKSMPDGNPRKLIDSSKINNLGWNPQVDLNEGLKLSYDWFLENC